MNSDNGMALRVMALNLAMDLLTRDEGRTFELSELLATAEMIEDFLHEPTQEKGAGTVSTLRPVE